MNIYTPLDEALSEYQKVLARLGMKPQFECVPVSCSAGRVTAAAVYAKICAPHYNASAMDGIVTCSSYTTGASEDVPVLLSAEQFERVDTGDPIPERFDCVVMIENVTWGRGFVNINAVSTPWKHVRVIGEDICAGDMILPSLTKITPSALGAMIAGGVLEVSVIKKPVVGFIPTGDEIIAPVSNPKAGEILEFNSAIVSAMLSEWGAEPLVFPIVRDDKELIKKALTFALGECDIVLIGAGASMGREDYTAVVISEVGDIVIRGIAMRPGKPTILGHSGGKPIIGMPGYPVSGIIVMEQIVQPLVNLLSHREKPDDKYVEAVLSRVVSSAEKFHEFTRVKLGFVQNKAIASPISGGSGVVTSFMKADGILEVPQGVAGYKSGEPVRVRLLGSEDELRRSIVAIGSHDPLLDELSDMLAGMRLSSTHAGSMSGLYAVRKGEAHLAGIHLLDEKTGEYNKSFVEKHFPEGGVSLHKCVKRKQGLILAKGNPKGIKGVADLTRETVRYINRQKGSGTRVLFDYLCRCDNVDADKIYGYEREVYTHAGVAALIAAGSADAGLGIYAAAKMYDLEFVHICDEDYDLLIAEHALELPPVQKLLEVLASEAFLARLEKLGGYR
ncbi:MAG: molybdopterin biosynthesis protein [Oscillospiraceae bacterium]|nr:molybdopterin biosynthesis protein [Oscillospiraceae bacterium]